MSKIVEWDAKRMRRQWRAERRRQRLEDRQARRLYRRVVKSLDRGEVEFRYNSPISDGFVLSDEVLRSCEAMLPAGVTLSQRLVSRGSYETDLMVSARLP